MLLLFFTPQMSTMAGAGAGLGPKLGAENAVQISSVCQLLEPLLLPPRVCIFSRELESGAKEPGIEPGIPMWNVHIFTARLNANPYTAFLATEGPLVGPVAFFPLIILLIISFLIFFPSR